MGEIKINKKFILSGILIVILLMLFSFLGLSLHIELQVKKVCENAMRMYSGDKVEILINVIQSDSECTKQKSHAIWALGQLGEKSALKFLMENYDNKSEKNICIYEAHFAIKKISEERFNFPAFMWRWIWTR